MNAEGLRAQAARLLAIALRAHGDGDEALADLLTKRALQYLDAIDAVARIPASSLIGGIRQQIC